MHRKSTPWSNDDNDMVIMMCQCKLISCNKCTTLVPDVGSRIEHKRRREEEHRRNMRIQYYSLSSSVNINYPKNRVY